MCLHVAEEDTFLSLPPKLTLLVFGQTCGLPTPVFLRRHFIYIVYPVFETKSDDKLVLGFPFTRAAYIGIYDEHPLSDFSLNIFMFIRGRR